MGSIFDFTILLKLSTFSDTCSTVIFCFSFVILVIKFLILLAKLLMVQEKTNLETAYMFKKLLNTLRQGEDIFRIVSSATHSGR